MNNRRAFTMVELLVVIAIIGVLLAILLPAVQMAREAARRSSCVNHLRQLGLATRQYHDTHGVFPPGLLNWKTPPGQPDPPAFRSVSLFVLILPHIEQGPLAQDWDYNDPRTNVSAGRTAMQLPLLICPSDPLPNTLVTAAPPFNPAGEIYALTSYGGSGGVQTYHPDVATRDGIFFLNSNIQLDSIRDGTTSTLLLGERLHRDPAYDQMAGSLTKIGGWGVWAPSSGSTGIGDVTLGTLVPPCYVHPQGVAVSATHEQRRVTAMGSGHSSGSNVALCDGSTRFISSSIDMPTFQALSTRAGREPISAW